MKRDPYFKIVCVFEHTRPFLSTLYVHTSVRNIFLFHIQNVLAYIDWQPFQNPALMRSLLCMDITKPFKGTKYFLKHIQEHLEDSVIIQWHQADRLKDSSNRILFRQDWISVVSGLTDPRPGIMSLLTWSSFISGNIVCDYMLVFWIINIFMPYYVFLSCFITSRLHSKLCILRKNPWR